MNQSPTPGGVSKVTVIADPDNISTYIGCDKKTIVLFEMTGCPYCRTFEPRFRDFSEKRSEDCNLFRVKLDNPGNSLWEKYEIMAVPTVIAFERGEIIARADSILAFGLSKKKWAEFCARL
jgi:thiol-disulfide isomerase/thioredoxin